MAHFNVLRKLRQSNLIECVDSSLASAHFATDLDTRRGIYAMSGMSGQKYRFFINTLVRKLDGTAYLEVGSWTGSTLCSAVHGNKVRAVAIDNWSQFGDPRATLFRNLQTFVTPGAEVHLIEGDFRAIDYRKIGLFEVYLFDGPHEEKDQYDGLTLPICALRDEFVFIVDDWNLPGVRQGTMDAIRHCDLDVLYAAEIRTTLDGSHPNYNGGQSDWHNGYYIAVLAKRAGPPTSDV